MARDWLYTLCVPVYYIRIHDLCVKASDQLNGASANSQDSVRLDVSANRIWGGS